MGSMGSPSRQSRGRSVSVPCRCTSGSTGAATSCAASRTTYRSSAAGLEAAARTGDPRIDLRAMARAVRAFAAAQPRGYALLFAPLPEGWRVDPDSTPGSARRSPRLRRSRRTRPRAVRCADGRRLAQRLRRWRWRVPSAWAARSTRPSTTGSTVSSPASKPDRRRLVVLAARPRWPIVGDGLPDPAHAVRGLCEVIDPDPGTEPIRPRLVHGSDLDRGGHFAGWQAPDLPHRRCPGVLPTTPARLPGRHGFIGQRARRRPRETLHRRPQYVRQRLGRGPAAR